MRQKAQLGGGIKPPPVVAVPTTPPLADDVANTAPGGHTAEQLGSAPFDARGTDCGKKRSCGSSAGPPAPKMLPATPWDWGVTGSRRNGKSGVCTARRLSALVYLSIHSRMHS